MATGIRDKVAIVGMGCTKFGERWDCGTEHLLAEAFGEALTDAGIEKAQIGARADFGRGRTLVGVDASLWLVDGLNGQGGLFATLTRRGVARRIELGAGAGVRFDGDAVGPALEAVLRIALPVRGFAVYLRYDGALLRSDGVSSGQNAGTVGVEARW